MASSPLAASPIVMDDDAADAATLPLPCDESNDRAYDYEDDATTLVEMTLVQSIRADPTLMKRIQYLLEMKRVSWVTLARLLVNFTSYSPDLLDDEDFKDFMLMTIVGAKSCSHSFAKTGYKTFHGYYTKLVCEDIQRNVRSCAYVHKLSLEDACLHVLRLSRKRFEYEWKRDHGKHCL